MKLTRFLLLLVAGLSMITISGCKKDSVTNPFDNINITENTPTFSNSPNSFAFSLTSNAFTHDYEYMLNMNTQTLSVAITVTNYSRGNIIVELYSDTNAKVFSRDLSSNTASSETFSFDSAIKRIDIHFVGSTASLNCAISAK